MSDVQKRLFTECSSLHQMMLIVFSKILRLRKYYNDNYFFELEIHGATVYIIDMANPFVNHLIGNSIMGAASAADKRYLQNVQLVFKLLNDDPERFVERFAICFDENNVPELASPTKRAPLSPVSDKGWNGEEILRMSHSVDEICGDLNNFPHADDEVAGGLQLSFRLDYNYNCPKGYQAPHFERTNHPTLKLSELMPPSIPTQMPPPVRARSEQYSKIRTSLAVESLLARGNSLPLRKSIAPRSRERSLTLNPTRTENSVDLSIRRMKSESRSQSRQPTVVLDDNEDGEDEEKEDEVEGEEHLEDEDDSDEEDEVEDVSDDTEEEEVTDEDEEEEDNDVEKDNGKVFIFDEEEEEEAPEEIETTRGEDEGRERRKRSVDGVEKGYGKKARPSSTSSLDKMLEKMDEDFDPNATRADSSMGAVNNTMQTTPVSPESPEMLSPPTSSPTEKKKRSMDGHKEEYGKKARLASNFRRMQERMAAAMPTTSSATEKRDGKEKDKKKEDDEEGSQEDLNKSMDSVESDGGESLFNV